MVSPDRTSTAPSACLASLPVSMEIVRGPIRTSRFCKLTLCMCTFVIRRPMKTPYVLLADTEAADQLRIAIGVLALQVIEQTPALPDQLEQAAARVMILRVNLEVFREVVDAVAEKRDLHFRRPCIAVVSSVRADDAALAVLA